MRQFGLQGRTKKQVFSNFKRPVYRANNKSRIFILRPNTAGSPKSHRKGMANLARPNNPRSMLHKCCCRHKVFWQSNDSNKRPLSFSFYSKGIYFFLQYPNTNVYKISIVQRRPQYANIRREMDYTTQAPDDERKKTVM